MSTVQCNSCGAFDDVEFCPHCKWMAVCKRCKTNHEMVCSDNQKKKARGQGPTVVRIVTKAVLVPPSEIEASPVSAAVEALLTAPILFTVTPAPSTDRHLRYVDNPSVDQQIDAVKNLLAE